MILHALICAKICERDDMGLKWVNYLIWDLPVCTLREQIICAYRHAKKSAMAVSVFGTVVVLHVTIAIRIYIILLLNLLFIFNIFNIQ